MKGFEDKHYAQSIVFFPRLNLKNIKKHCLGQIVVYLGGGGLPGSLKYGARLVYVVSSRTATLHREILFLNTEQNRTKRMIPQLLKSYQK